MAKTTELVVTVNGDLSVESNIDAYKEHILAELAKADRELKTDQDFADADQLVKRLDAAEKAMAGRKDEILQQAEDIYQVIDALDQLDAKSREVRLKLSKQIKAMKESRKNELRDDAADRCADILNALADKFPMVPSPHIQISDRLDKAMFRKSSLDSIKVALDAVVAEIGADVARFEEMYQANHDLLEGIDPSFMAAFQDTGNLMSMSTDVLTVEIAKRIEQQKRVIAEAKAEEERQKREQEAQNATKAREAAEKAEKSPELPPETSQEAISGQPPAIGAGSEKSQPAAAGEALSDIEMVVLVRVRGSVETGRRIRGIIESAVEPEYSVIGTPFLTSPTKLREKYSQ